MNLTYEVLFDELRKKYILQKRNGEYCFVNNDNEVVAIISYNKIVMYYTCSSQDIFNHKNKVAAIFTMDLNVNGKLCDIISILGLCGSSNDISVIKNFGLDSDCNYRVFCNPEEYQKQLEFNNLQNNSLNGAIIAQIDEKIGSCGELTMVNGKANITIGNILINNLTYCQSASKYGFDINILNIKGDTNTNYDEVYKYYREANNWYYTYGYNSKNSDIVRDFTERRKKSTFDKEKVHTDAQVIIIASKLKC